MKHWKVIISALALSAVIGMSLTACSGSDSKEIKETSSTSSATSVQSSKTQESTQTQESSIPVILESNTVSKEEIVFGQDSNIKAVKYKTLEEYLKSDSAKKAIADLNKSDVENSLPMENTVKVEGDTKLVFERTYTEQLNYPDAVLKTLTTTMDEQKQTYTDLVGMLRECINSNHITVVVRYYDYEGNVIFEREFDEKDVVVSDVGSSDENADENAKYEE